jgi:glutathione peroxidase
MAGDEPVKAEELPVSLYDIPLHTLAGTPTSLADLRGKALLIVNVASKCGLTPQYAGLEQLQERYADRGFSVVGFPCNQFGGQEPGSAEEIQTFCSATYGVTFPMMAKIDVNGEGRHPVYQELTEVEDAKGDAGDIQWNFEKFLLDPDGAVVARFRPTTTPTDDDLVKAIEAALPN